jgi:hypothetical protein
MNEVFPIAAGVAIGFLTLRIGSSRLRIIALITLSIIFGMLATIISGEVDLSWGFFPVDIALVLVTAVATAVLTTGLRRRPNLHS